MWKIKFAYFLLHRLEELEGTTAEKQKLGQLLQQREEKIIVLDSK